ncbi:hypothetical protein [Natronobacterium gregoryi]|uniref:Uncharacterized protein n=2 Tax=Natronobacterium gregoryi TaxID=44930 RepID=L0AL21_NATGS|nr:hypothetical protein [Natronobacterium gregoryi]AFZ74501.1 hypothetical protein Natgr_3380 [Natronobacterium gregoryi SP2]ELY72425.1 hypothetical protein C490_03738 [Natronobacterium gregoryi SP2]PLK21753.1 hypothetical protein CYV19_02650 [Natronobacterium gregoryi SP2]SFI98422.1 hypothetical protein SAMN05443661_110207 [Natronobacterium gregoryi]
MNDRTVTITGLFGALVVALLAVLGVYGFVTGYLLESPGDLFVPSIGVLAVTIVVVGALILLGARSSQWRQNPYW